MEAAPLKLMYFEAKGRAEIPRIMLADAGVKYEDARIPKDQWPKVKPTLPFKQMPVLYVGDVAIAQSLAITQYIAKRFGFVTGDLIKDAQLQMFSSGLTDLQDKVRPAVWATEGKEQKIAEVFKTEVPSWLGLLENAAKVMGAQADKGYLAGDKFTFADVHLYHVFLEYNKMKAGCFKDFPILTGIATRVGERPNVAAWIKARPDTPF